MGAAVLQAIWSFHHSELGTITYDGFDYPPADIPSYLAQKSFKFNVCLWSMPKSRTVIYQFMQVDYRSRNILLFIVTKIHICIGRDLESLM